MGISHTIIASKKLEEGIFTRASMDVGYLFQKAPGLLDANLEIGNDRGFGEPIFTDHLIAFSPLTEGQETTFPRESQKLQEPFMLYAGFEGTQIIKTETRRYDFMTCASLVVLKNYFMKDLKVFSDSYIHQWIPAMIFVQTLFGYGLDFVTENYMDIEYKFVEKHHKDVKLDLSTIPQAMYQILGGQNWEKFQDWPTESQLRLIEFMCEDVRIRCNLKIA